MFSFTEKFFKKKNSNGSNKPQESQEVETKVETTEEEVNAVIVDFVSHLSTIASIQKHIEAETAALDALFVRRFKKFHNVQDYLDFLKVMKFKDTYKEFNVDLDSGDLVSIDAYCKSALGEDRYKKEYWPVSIVAVEVNGNDGETIDDVVSSDKDKKEEDKATVSFDNIIKEEVENESAVKFQTEGGEAEVKGTVENAASEDRAGEGTGSDVSEDVSSGSSSDRTRDVRNGSGQGSSSSSPVLTPEQKKLKKELDRVANLIKGYVDKGTEIIVQKTVYHGMNDSGTYDLTIKDNNGQRVYTLDKGSIIPGRLSVIALIESNNTIAVPVVKQHKELLRKLFKSIYVLSNDEAVSIYNKYFLTDMHLYWNIDFTDALFLVNMNKDNKEIFTKNLNFVLQSLKASTGKDMRYRISKFKWINDFELSSDSKCVSPVGGFLTSTEIGHIKVEYKKDANIKVSVSDDRKKEDKNKENSTITSNNATPETSKEVKDQRVA